MKGLYNDNKRLLRDSLGSLYCYWGLAALMAALYALLSYLTPLYLDDWSFMAVWRDDVDGSYTFSWQTWGDYFKYIRGFDNGRIANALSPFSTMFSPWKEIFPVLTGIGVAVSAVLVQKFATGRRSIPALVLTWVLMIVGLPWIDTLFVRDYSLNYIWASAFTLAFLFSLHRACREKIWIAPALVLAVLAGGWHESFAFATLCGLALLVLKRRFSLPKVFFLITAVYLAATLIFMLSPGLIHRFNDTIGNGASRHLLKRPLVIIAIDAILFLTFWASCVAKSGGKVAIQAISKTFDSTVALVSLGILVGGYLLGFFTVNTFRSFFWPDMAGVAIAVILIKRLCGLYSFSSFAIKVVAFTIFALCTLQSVYSIIWQAKYRKETDEIMALLDKSDSGTVYFDSRLATKAPLFTLDIPVAHAWRNPYHYHALWSYYMTPVLGVVPTDLKDASIEKATPLDGDIDAYLYNDLIISPYIQWNKEVPYKTAETVMRLNIEIEGVKKEGNYTAFPFVTERGDTLLYYSEN